MADQKFQRDTQRFDFIGLDLNRPVDSVKPGKLPFGQNIRSFLAGRIEPRDGLTLISPVVAGQSPVHSCRRLNDTANATYARIVGAGTHVAYGQNTFTDLDSGYSGDPLALVPWKPTDSPRSFMYIGDRSRMRKVSAAGDLHPIGLAAPATAPAVALTNAPSFKDVDTFSATTGWAQALNAGAPSLVSRTPGGGSGTTTTIAQILYDNKIPYDGTLNTTGWASVQLTSMVGVGRGERLHFATNAEDAYVQDVFAGLSGTTSTTIANILYDTGSTGMCSIALTAPIEPIDVNGMLRDTTVNENIRVQAHMIGPDGTYSIRASTVATFAAGDNIEVRPSLRIYLTNNHAAAENVSKDAMTFQVTAGTGTMTKTATPDLTKISSTLPAQPDDYMSIGLLVDAPQSLTEIKIQLDVDATVANQDFAHNYYQRVIRASDLTPSVANQQPLVNTAATIIQRQIIDAGFTQSTPTGGPIDVNAPPTSEFPTQGIQNPSQVPSVATTPFTSALSTGDLANIVPGGRFPRSGQLLTDQVTTAPTDSQVQSQQLEAGASQWVDIRFRISELIRVGTDDSRTLQNVQKIQLLVTCTGTVNISCDSWWIGGGYGPDDLDATAIPYYYRYRARVLSTNVPSNWSPATRLSIDAYRQSVTVTPPQYAAPAGSTLVAATDLVLDIERFGGQLADWHYIGTTSNGATPSFTDVYADLLVAGQPILNMDNYQPWPVLGLPVSGTTGTVAGTSVQDSGTNFNTSWAPGTRILISNQPYTIYRVQSTSLLEIVENAGSQSGVSWQINLPTILAQPLAVLWEWDGTFFACGDAMNPGRLYYTNPDSETTLPDNWIDITSPSEPLMNGLQYNIRSYVFSSEGFIQILKTGNASDPYRHEHIPNGKGLFSRWAMTREPSPVICFLSKDGINMTTGGSPNPLTDADLYELFPNEGNIGVNVNGIGPPNIVSAQATNLRLAYYDEYLYFDHIDTNSIRATLVLSFDLGAAVRGEAPGGWIWDKYTPAAVFHYGEEGSSVHSLLIGTTDSNLYQYTGNSDNGAAIEMSFTTPSRDQGDPRSNKFYGDVMVDSNTAGINATVTPYINNNATALTPFTLNTATRSQVGVPLGSAWVTAKNISINVDIFVSTSARPFFFIWEPRWTFESAPISALSWEISPTTFGMEGFKHFGQCKVTHVSTSDLSLIFTVDNAVQPTITIPNSGGVYRQTIFRVPVMKGKLYKLRVASSAEFRLDTRDSFFEVKDWGMDTEYQKLRIFGDFSMVEG